jgi:DNA-binding CsgD family transcriptional regulator
MNQFEFSESFTKIANQFLDEAPHPEEVNRLVDLVLQEHWVKNLLIFTDQAILIINTKTGDYIYQSPSLEVLIGYKKTEIPNVHSLIKLATEKELTSILKTYELGLSKFASLNSSLGDQHKIRFSRNGWFVRKDGKPINVLQHSRGIAFDQKGMPTVELMIISDITHFNSSPNHFYSIAKTENDGTSEVLFHGMLEEEQISLREREIYSLLTRGKTSDEIAAQLKISTETVKSHRKNLLQKTGSENSIDLLRYGFAQGWI